MQSTSVQSAPGFRSGGDTRTAAVRLLPGTDAHERPGALTRFVLLARRGRSTSDERRSSGEVVAPPRRDLPLPML